MNHHDSQEQYSLRSVLPLYIAAALGAFAGACIFFLLAALTHYYIYLLAVPTGYLCLLGYSKLNGPQGRPKLICLALFTIIAITLGFALFYACRLHTLNTAIYEGVSFRMFILVDPVAVPGGNPLDMLKIYLITMLFACLGFAGKDILPSRKQDIDQITPENEEDESDLTAPDTCDIIMKDANERRREQ